MRTCESCGRPEALAEPFVGGECIECLRKSAPPPVLSKPPAASPTVAVPKPTKPLCDCPACGKLISTAAIACPSCGHPMRDSTVVVKTNPVVMYFAIALLVVIAGLLVSCVVPLPIWG